MSALLEHQETMLRVKLPARVMALLQRALRELSLAAGRPLPMAEGLECLCAEYLSGSVEEWREEVARDQAARKSRGAAPARPEVETPEGESEKPARVSVDEADQAPPLAALAARKLICPATEVDLVVPDKDAGWSNPGLRFSGEARAATPAQRQELLRRDGYCCANPGCPNKLWLDVHHVVFYYVGGVTLPHNMIVCCTRCHRNIHKGRLRVSGTAPHGLVWTDQHGERLERAFDLGPADVPTARQRFRDPSQGLAPRG